MHDSSVNGMDWEAWLKERVALAESAAAEAEAKAKSAVAKADAEARVAVAEALEAEAKAKVADAEARVTEAQAATKVRVAAAEALEADLKIVKLRKELEVLTGESEVQEYLLFLSLRPSLCLSLTACFSDLNSLGSPYSVFASVFLFFFLTGVPLDGRDEEQNSGTVLLEDSELNKQKHSSPRSPRFSEDGLKRKRIEPSTPDCSSR